MKAISRSLRLNGSRNNVYHIEGIPVQFPYQPYGSQLAFMGKIISTLDRALKDGHSNAILESPTGTGKTLSLLCSLLAWQQNYKYKGLASVSPSESTTNGNLDPVTHGGGFIPESQPSSTAGLENTDPAKVNAPKKAKKRTVPKNVDPAKVNAPKKAKQRTVPRIFYASRTHSQITQVIREYRKTAYRVPMAVLGSRKLYCINTHVRGSENIDEECKHLLDNENVGCPKFKNFYKIKSHPSLQKGGCHEAYGIEDLVKIGKIVNGCPYFATCSLAENAELIFCPYSYIINPIVRKAMDIDIRGAILVLDEAHNIEDAVRDVGSVNIEEDMLRELQIELEQLCLLNSLVYQPLLDTIQGIVCWMSCRKNSLERRDFQHYFSCWTGDRALRELQEAQISRSCFPILNECAKKAVKVASEAESGVAHLSGMSAIILEGLFSSLSYLFSEEGLCASDYQLALQHLLKKDAVYGV